jgi:hypothetical protein
MTRQLVPSRDVDRIATAPALGGAIVTAVHIPADRAVYVACSRHGVIVTDAYGPDARLAEVRAACRGANIRTHAHAAGCTADRVKRSVLVATGSGAR